MTWNSEPTIRERPGRSARCGVQAGAREQQRRQQVGERQEVFGRFARVHGLHAPVDRFLEHERGEDRQRDAGEVEREQRDHARDAPDVDLRSRNDSAGGRLRRMSRSERSVRRVVTDSVGRADVRAPGSGRRGWRSGGVDVPDTRGPISPLTTPQPSQMERLQGLTTAPAAGTLAQPRGGADALGRSLSSSPR